MPWHEYRQAPKPAVTYGLAIGVVLIGLLLRLVANPFLGPTVPYLSFFPAILIASWFGGLGPGIVAAVVSAIAADIWFLMPEGLFKIPAASDQVSLGLFVLVGFGIAAVGGAMRRAEVGHRRVADAWRTTLSSIGDGVIVTDETGHVTFVNSAAERLTGWTAAEARGRALDDVFVIANEKTGQPVENPVPRVLRDGKAVSLADRTILKHRAGGWAPIVDSASPVYDDGSVLRGVVLVIRDQSDERESTRALSRSQGLLKATSDNSPTVTYVKDLDGRYLFVNQRFLDFFHVTPEQILGYQDTDLFTPEVAERFREMDRRVAVSRVALTEEEVVPIDGTEFTYLSVKCPLWDEHGEPYAIFGVSTDITERKRTLDAVRANEERTRLIIETALDAVVTIDSTGAITGWSPQAERTFGWTRDEVIGRPLAETVVPHEHRAAHTAGIERYLTGGPGNVLNQRLELSALHRDGRVFPIELSITPVRIGDKLAFSAFVRDITERKRMEHELVESRRYYQALAESLPHLVWTCRADGYCDFLSRQWVDYTGQPAEEQVGTGWMRHVHPDDRTVVEAEWANAVARGDALDVEFRIRRHDGVYRWFKTRAVPLRDAAGSPIKWFGSNTDVEDYKHAASRLRAQLERLDLLDRLTRAIGERQDLGGIFQVVMGSLEDQLPLDFCCVCLYDVVDQTLTVAAVGERGAGVGSALAMTTGTRIPIDSNGLSRCVRGHLVYEPDVRGKSLPFARRLAAAGLRAFVGAPLLVESNVFGVLVAARRTAAAFTSADCEFLRQLSEHVALAAHQARLHSALQRAYDDLRQTQQAVMQQERLKALGQMASGIAHDINNAISPVALYTESLLEGEPGLSDRAREYLQTIQRSSEDVAQTVARMREFYRPREAELVLLPVDVNHVMRDVIDLTRARWNDMPQQRGVMIELAARLPQVSPVLLGVESELREALINLVFNAVDAMPTGGTITMKAEVERGALRATGLHRDEVVISVSDTGIGMDADTRRRCLEPFFTTKGERGTGLGLATVYGMVQRHGGDIRIDSAPGAGTTVRLVFQAAPESARAGSDEPAVYARPGRLRILVVDDDPLLLKSLRDTLEIDGHVVTIANGGQAGIDAFTAGQASATPFSAVITDLGMPYVDGRQVAAHVKQHSPATPVLLLTGWGQRLVDDADIPPHVDRVLNKPPRLADFRTALAELTGVRT
jgi:PAS domain S-box-containing protein